jgi:hypothetical protein
MMVGQFIGASLGAQMVVKGGTKFIRPVIVVMCFAMLGRVPNLKNTEKALF